MHLPRGSLTLSAEIPEGVADMPIDRRAVHHPIRRPTVGPAILSLAFLSPLALESQAVNVSLRTAAMLGQGIAASVGARVDAGSAQVGVYGHVGQFTTTQGCETSLPPTCNHPSTGGTELSGGIRVAFPTAGRTYPVLSAGVGVLMWGDDPPYRSRPGLLMDLEVGVQGQFVLWADYTVGLKLQRVAQGVSGGMRLESKDGTYTGFFAGVVVPLRRQ
jgi:hypothetical protein